MVVNKYIFAGTFAAGFAVTAYALRDNKTDTDPINILVVRPGDVKPNIYQVYKADVILAEIDGEFTVVKGTPDPDAVTVTRPDRYAGSLADILSVFNSIKR